MDALFVPNTHLYAHATENLVIPSIKKQIE